METLLHRLGLLAEGELEARLADPGSPARPVEPPPGSDAPLMGGYVRAVDAAPRFSAGDAVRARNLHPAGHTRLPRYVRGRRGSVDRVYPAFVFPDTSAHDRGEQPQYLYNVRFDGAELWGPAAEPGSCVSIDLFESYLETSEPE
jgi:nitrile hydratase